MSVPKNHHYVSRCQIEQFFNKKERKLYLFDKILNKFFSVGSTKNIFSEDFGNTTIVENEVDHISLEQDLKNNFEDRFQKDLQVIHELIKNPKNPPYNYTPSLHNMIKYGIVGSIRNPIYKQESDDLIVETLLQFFDTERAQQFKEYVNQTKHLNKISYSDFANKVFEAMEDVWCIIYVIENEDQFILPDQASVLFREKINEYFNSDVKEISKVGIPLSSKIFLHSEPKKLGNLNNHKIFRLKDEHKSEINKINRALFLTANKFVACQDEKYLSNFVSMANQSLP